ncbi:FecR family protein [Paramagnetospirillum kuznetsovii]|nr:FecR domain-containing protein [Paramagnetospirillum kuznetsovii]
MLDSAMARPDDIIASKIGVLRSVYAGEINALKRRGRRRRALRLGGLLAIGGCVAVAALLGQFGWREVAAGKTAPTILALGDGSRIHLDAGGVVEIPLAPWRREARLLKGDAVFDVIHDDAHPFVVRSGTATVTDLGTRFLVRAGRESIGVAVFEGRVEIVSAMLPAMLDAGHAAEISKDGIVPAAMPDEAEATAWRNGRIVFRNTPLSVVAERLSRYRPEPVRVATPTIADLKVSGSFRIDDPEGVLQTLERALPIRVRRDGAAVTLTARP